TVDSNGPAAGGIVDGIVSSLTINGQGGTNTLLLEDSSDPNLDTGDKVHVTPTQIGAAAGDNYFGPGGFVTYSDLNAVTLDMSDGYFPDTVYLMPSPTTTFYANGGLPPCPMNPDQLPGDALYLDMTGVTGRHLTASGDGPGMWTFTNRQPVVFT